MIRFQSTRHLTKRIFHPINAFTNIHLHFRSVSNSNLSWQNPYSDLINSVGYKDITEIQKFNKLFHDISQIDEDAVHQNKESILCSTVPLELEGSAARLCEGMHFESVPLSMDSITSSLSDREWLLLFDSAILSQCIHIQSRIASFEGKGFYTIGPCGEECLSPIGITLDDDDAVALHYRHLAVSLARNLKRSGYDGDLENTVLSNVVRDRARGYVVSTEDPISEGGHCLLGSTRFDRDFIVTSTLASQCGPAVGRAMGNVLCRALKVGDKAKFPAGSLSFVSVGDGSVNNSHFLSAVNTADYAIHHGLKLPLLMAVSNNSLCISLKDRKQWLFGALSKLRSFRKFRCDGNNALDVLMQIRASTEYVRSTQRPAVLVMDAVKRQFGHAATDRQSAYLTAEQIEDAANNEILQRLCQQMIALQVLDDRQDALQRVGTLSAIVRKAFESVYNEPKLDYSTANRQRVVDRNSAPLRQYQIGGEEAVNQLIAEHGTKRLVMRKGMTFAVEEALCRYTECVYIGEDVVHGGYYLVTDGLAQKYKLRVCDFPPDETSLMGAAIGYAQSGLTPIVEMPYAKYLDCAADAFFEAVIMNWLSAGKQPNGMMIRLQGFGNGLFGGNFHTHNALHIPPGLDVVCWSNGIDYVKGWRYCMQQVTGGRCVMSVDCTSLLNTRHVFGDEAKDGLMMTLLPHSKEYLTFNDVMVYNGDNSKFILYNSTESESDRVLQSNDADTRYIDTVTMSSMESLWSLKQKGVRIVIISYGVGVNTARQAQKALVEMKGIGDVLVVDTPYLSDTPKQLQMLLDEHRDEVDCIVFADMCKEGQNPLNGMVLRLQRLNILQSYEWMSCAALNTYNPLGKDLTFLSKDDVVEAVQCVVDNLENRDLCHK